MKHKYSCLTYYILILLFAIPLNVLSQEHPSKDFKEASFIENKGQWGEAPLYRATFHGGYAYLEEGKITYVAQDMEEKSDFFSIKHNPQKYKNKPGPDPEISHHAYQVNFKGSNKDAKVIPSEKADDYANFFLGDDPSKWARNVKKYHTVTYRNLYPGINMKFHKNAQNLKYTFIVQSGADVNDIKAEYQATEHLKLQDGQLVIETSVQDVMEIKPYAFQIINGDTVDIECNYKITNDVVSYQFPKGYNHDQKLYIDPTLVFSTFTGSTSDNWGYTATYDSEGYAYGGGIVFGSGYPTTLGAYDVNYSGGTIDIVITKFDTTGTKLIYSTYLGGSSVELPHSLICNSYDDLLLYGTTSSTDFPTTSGVIDPTFSGGTPVQFLNVINFNNGSDIVVSKLSNDGTSLMASTYVGGAGNDGLNTSSSLNYNYADEVRGEIMVDENDNVFVATSTNSQNFPMAGNGYQQSNKGGQDAVIFKTTTYLDGLIWSTYLGGSKDDAAYNTMVTEDFKIYVAGGTESKDFPVTLGAYSMNYNGGQADGFVSLLNINGDKLLASTYYGSSAYDQIYFVEQDLDQSVYVLGQTGASGGTFIDNVNWSQTSGGQFISKFNNVLAGRTWSTAFGNPGSSGPDISPTSFMIDYCKNIYIAGWGGGLNGFGGTSGLPVTANAFQTTTDNKDYYFMVLDKNAKNLQYATFFGGSQSIGEHVDGGTSRFSKKGAIYQAICSGCGGYSDLPTTSGAWSNTNNSNNCNLAVVKFKFDVKAVIADYEKPYSGCVPYTVHFKNHSYSSGNNTYYLWDFDDGDTAMQYSPSHTFTQSGTYTVTLKVVDSTSCNIADSVKYDILVLDDKNDTLPVKKPCRGDSTKIGIKPLGNPQIVYNWSPVVYKPGTLFMDTSNISKSQTKVLPRNDTTFYLKINNGACVDSLVQYVDVIDIKADAGPDKFLCDSMVTLKGKGSGDDSLMFIWSENGTFTDTLNKNIYDGTLNYKLKNPGNLYLKVTNGDCKDIDSVYLDYKINLTDSVKGPTCHGDCDGYIKVNAAGGIPPYNFYWSNGDTGNDLTNLCGGSYTVTVYDSDSCLMLQTVNIPEPQPLEENITTQNAPCEEVCIGEAMANPTGGTAPYTYQWNNGQKSDTISNLCPGTFKVTITDAHKCVSEDTVVIEDMSQYVNFEAHAKNDTIFEGESTTIYTKDTANYTYRWQPAKGLSNPMSHSTKASPDETTTYVVTIEDSYGCVYKDTVTVHVKPVTCGEPYIFVPNAFTPDNDGKNDVLYVRTKYAKEIKFVVYNRWGEKVFKTEDVNKGWDGTIDGKKAEPGVYSYYLYVLCYTDEVYEDNGNITLIR